MEIRLENENDYFEVEVLVRNSFWNIYRRELLNTTLCIA
jgi:hypothetical protein